MSRIRSVGRTLGASDRFRSSGVGLARRLMDGNLVEPQRAYLWELNILDSEGGYDNNLSTYALSASIPARNHQPLRRSYMGQNYSITGKNTSPNSFRMTVYDDSTLAMYRYMSHWINICSDPEYNRSVGFGNASKDIELITKGVTNVLVSGRFRLEGAMPTEIGTIEMSYDNNDVMKFDITFSFTKFYLNEQVSNNYSVEGKNPPESSSSLLAAARRKLGV